MRDALLADLSALGMDCITSHDIRVAAPVNADSIPVKPADHALTVWRAQLAQNAIDACWVIAPETGGILHQISQLAEASGKKWIGCSAGAIALTTSKSRLAERCIQAGIPVLPYVFLDEVESLERFPWYHHAWQYGWVVKPDDGAGCESTFYFNKIDKVIEYKSKHSNGMLLQPYLPGKALSMSVLSSRDQVKVIAGHEQWIEIENDCFHFQGAGVNQASEHLPAMQQLAEALHQAIPGLTGYWGADMILDENHGLTLVEVNPRLTTPYIALASLMEKNPAELILAAALDNTVTREQARSYSSVILPNVTIIENKHI